MLLRVATLKQIRAGEVDLAFRRWRKPTVRTGGTLNTAVGLLAIDAVEEVAVRQITAADAKRAGFPSRKALLDELAGRDGTLYRIRLHWSGEDPRREMRDKERVSKADLEEIALRLDRMDARASDGPWTREVLRQIEKNPGLRALDLAAKLGVEKDWLKPNIRKLKNLGLTISLGVGYEISPRGAAFLRATKRKR